MKANFKFYLSQQRILGGAAVLAALQLGASLAGLMRDRLLNATFPQLAVVDVYIAAFRPSDLLFQMLIMAGFSVALVPLLAQYQTRNQPSAMADLLAGVMGLAAVVFGGLALLLAVFFRDLAPYLTRFSGAELELYIQFGRLALLTNFLFVFGNALGQYLITRQRYWVYGLTPIFYTLGTILGTIYLTPVVGPFGPIYGTVLGAVGYVLWRLLAVTKLNKQLPQLKLWHGDLPELIQLMWPRMLALGALQLELLLFDTVASGLPAGSITVNANARNFQSVVVGVIGIALAQSAFSLLSQAAAQGQAKRFGIYLRKGILMIVALAVPAAIILVFCAPLAAWLVHLSHRLPVFSVSLLLYAISIPFESLNHLLLRSFYALKQTVIPAVFSVVNGTIAITVAWLLVGRLGVYSLALAFTAGQIVQLVGLALYLPRQLGSRFKV